MHQFIKILLRVFPRPFLIRLSLVGNKFVAFFLKGDAVHCPVCEKSFRKFLPYGYVTKRENALCPNCLSLERHRLMWLFLKEKGLLAEKRKVLHIAPEQPFVKRFKRIANWEYTTADLVSPLADVKLDVQHIPFDDELFDLVICNHVLEHVDDDRKAMSELYRILKKGGNALLQVPVRTKAADTDEDASVIDPKERERRFGQYDHVRMYGMDYFSRLEEIGFVYEREDVYYVEGISEEKRKRYCLSDEELLPFFKK